MARTDANPNFANRECESYPECPKCGGEIEKIKRDTSRGKEYRHTCKDCPYGYIKGSGF